MHQIKEEITISDHPEVVWVVGVGGGHREEDPDGGGVDGAVRVMTQ